MTELEMSFPRSFERESRVIKGHAVGATGRSPLQSKLTGVIILFEQTFKNIDDILHKDAGCSSELDYVEQTSWILFLKYLDDFEKEKKTAEKLAGKTYNPIISAECR